MLRLRVAAVVVLALGMAGCFATSGVTLSNNAAGAHSAHNALTVAAPACYECRPTVKC